MVRISANAILKQVSKDHDTILSGPYKHWLSSTQGNQPYPTWVAERIQELLVEQPRVRHASFGGSEAGQCLRKQEFAYIGINEISRYLQTDYVKVADPGLINIFNDGKWRHLRWQANLLTCGLFTQVEYPLPWPSMRSRGTVDGVGIVRDDHPNPDYRGKFFGTELKGMNSWQYKKWIAADDQQAKHKGQFSRYFLSGGFDLFIVLYECKDTNEFHEWVYEPDTQLLTEARIELAKLNAAVESQRLHQPLPSCAARMGNVWKGCPYGGRNGICERMDRWP